MGTILCISERFEDVRQIQASLQREGHEVLSAEDRFRAVEILVERTVDAAILFLRAGSKELWDLIPVLGRLDPKLPVLTVAEEDTVEAQREIRRSRVFYHLTYPVDLDELRQALQEALARREAK